MKYPSLDYDNLVEGFRRKIAGNIESKSMTSEECAQEIKDITGNVFEELPIATDSILQRQLDAGSANRIVEPKKRGRPKGSRNRPKSP